MTDSDRSFFDIPSGTTYLNTANIGPRLKAVSDAGRQAVDRFSRPWEITADDWFEGPERLRTAVAELFGVAAERLALVPAASYGIAIAAKNLPLPTGSSIVMIDEQYPSNVYAWRRRAAESRATIRVAQRSDTLSLTDAILEQIDRDTAIVTIPNGHWTDGERIDLVAVGEAARSHGAALVIDASQSLGALPIDLAAVRPDFVVTVGYKWLLGPYGLGYLVVGERWCDAGIPLEESWLTRRGSDDFSRLVDYVDAYRDGARRFDFGEFPQLLTMPMAIAAIDQLNRWGMDHVRAGLVDRTRRIRSIGEALGFEAFPEARGVGHMIGMRLPAGQSPVELGERLRAADVHVSVRGDKLRVAPHLHTDDNDLDRFAEVLRQGVARP